MATQPSYSTDLASRANEVADELALLVRQAQVVTRASGAAIAVSETDRNEFFCRASSGPNAPDIGVPVPVEGTLAGACIEAGKEVFCHEVERDSRVDAAAARVLGIRSILVMPITEQVRVSGVLAVFSATPNAFSSAHVAGLKALADQISAVLQKERAAEERPEPSIRPTPAVLKMVLPTADLAPAFGRVLSAPLEKDKKDEPEQTPIRWRWFATIKVIGAKLVKTGRNQRTVIATIAAILLVVVATLLLRRSSSSVAPALALEHARNDAVPSPSPGPASQPVQPTDRSAGTKPELSQQVVSNGLKDNQGEQPEETHRRDQPVVLVPDSKTSARRLALPAQPQSEDVGPNLSLGRSSASDLTLLAQPANSLPSAVASSSGFVKAKLIHVVNPVYPNIAKTTRISGLVVLQILVEKDGRVSNPKFISGPLALRDSAFNAVRQWIFQPAMLHGQPVEQETRVTLKFQP